MGGRRGSSSSELRICSGQVSERLIVRLGALNRYSVNHPSKEANQEFARHPADRCQGRVGVVAAKRALVWKRGAADEVRSQELDRDTVSPSPGYREIEVREKEAHRVGCLDICVCMILIGRLERH